MFHAGRGEDDSDSAGEGQARVKDTGGGGGVGVCWVSVAAPAIPPVEAFLGENLGIVVPFFVAGLVFRAADGGFPVVGLVVVRAGIDAAATAAATTGAAAL